MNADEIKNITHDELISMLCSSHSASLMFPNDDRLRTDYTMSKEEVLRRLSFAERTDNSEKGLTKLYNEFIELFNSLLSKRYRGDSKSKRQFSARNKEGYSMVDFSEAIKNCMVDEYHKETNFKYLTPEFITRADKLERYLNVSPPPAKQDNNKQSYAGSFFRDKPITNGELQKDAEDFGT